MSTKADYEDVPMFDILDDEGNIEELSVDS